VRYVVPAMGLEKYRLWMGMVLEACFNFILDLFMFITEKNGGITNIIVLVS
jgi:hypothetical protein